MQRLKEAAEKAKMRAVRHDHRPMSTCPSSPRMPPAPSTLDMTLTRAKFNELTADLVEATMGPVRRPCPMRACKPSDIGKVLLVGGSTRIPAVQEAVKKLHGQGALQGHQPR